mgnify:CR=1 FL=1
MKFNKLEQYEKIKLLKTMPRTKTALKTRKEISKKNFNDQSIELNSYHENSNDPLIRLILLILLGLFYGQLRAQTIIMETGKVNVNHNVQSVVLNNTFIDPVVIILAPTFVGWNEITVRLNNITPTGFDTYLEEPINRDGPHSIEEVHYVVIEKGTYTFDDGTMLEAGVVTSSNLSFQTVDLLQTYATTPAIFSQVQTDFSSTNFLKTRQRNATESSFNVKLEREESLAAVLPVSEENVGYFAISKGGGALDGITIEANSFSVDEVVATRVFTESFSTGNHMIASIATYNGNNPSSIRTTELTSTQVSLFIEEDMSNDEENNHAFETVDYFVIDGGESGVFSPILLPIELLSFQVYLDVNGSVKLQWITASEINNDYFNIERSRDGTNWDSFLIIDGAGNSSSTINYNSFDVKPYPGLSYYRLKQVDFDGSYSYSDVRSVNFDKNLVVSAYPNPAQSDVTILINSITGGIAEIIVYDLTGRNVYISNLEVVAGIHEYNLDFSKLPSGSYVLNIDLVNQKTYAQIHVQIE